MATPVIMPRQGQTVESCVISEWHKQKGDKVTLGESLFSYETDKATFTEEAKVEGTLLEVFFDEGDEVPVLTNVCVIGSAGESAEEFRPEGMTSPTGALDGEETHATQAPTDHLKISPRARHLADKTSIDVRHASPSGPYGRIIERDIDNLVDRGGVMTPAAKEEYASLPLVEGLSGTGPGGRIKVDDLKAAQKEEAPLVPASGQQPPPKIDYEDVRLTNIRRVIADAMHESLASTAQVTMHGSCDATDVLAFRKRLKEAPAALGLAAITLTDMIVYAVSRTLIHHPQLNAHFLGDRMRFFRNTHLGVAVNTDRGLMVPTVVDANLKSLAVISRELKRLAAACHAGDISPDELKGGTFTITNLGSLGVESFTPVLNPPQTAILGVNAIRPRTREVAGEYVYYPALGLSLTFDHRALDGAPAAKFLQDLRTNLESFSLLLAG